MKRKFLFTYLCTNITLKPTPVTKQTYQSLNFLLLNLLTTVPLDPLSMHLSGKCIYTYINTRHITSSFPLRSSLSKIISSPIVPDKPHIVSRRKGSVGYSSSYFTGTTVPTSITCLKVNTSAGPKSVTSHGSDGRSL